jgi:hypothetical protein
MKPSPLASVATFAWMLFGHSAPTPNEIVRLYFDPDVPQIAFAAGDIKAALEKRRYAVQTAFSPRWRKAAPAPGSSSPSPRTRPPHPRFRPGTAGRRRAWARRPTPSGPRPGRA